MDSVMEKLYMPSQDQIIGGLNSEGKIHNVLKGSQQQFEINQNLAASADDDLDVNDGEGESSLQNSSPMGARSRANHGIREQEWANELRRADERSNEIRTKYEELVQSHLQIEERVKKMSEQIEVRDNEILRLGGLYQGGQNLDQLHMKYQQDQNEKTVQKLQNQVDFLNKENHRIQVQLEIF